MECERWREREGNVSGRNKKQRKERKIYHTLKLCGHLLQSPTPVSKQETAVKIEKLGVLSHTLKCMSVYYLIDLISHLTVLLSWNI